MTVVIARVFENYIWVASDTEITETGAARRDIIPGGLKSIVIDLNCSIALAGNYVRGLDLVRNVRKAFLRTRDFDQLLELLRRDSESGECDYLVSMHRPYAELRKIWRGQVSDSMTAAWLGNPDTAARLLQLDYQPVPSEPRLQPEPGQLEFYGYQKAVQEINMREGVSLAEGVGGILIFQIGSPWGHTYSNYAGATSWQITINPALNSENDRARASGEKSFAYSVHSPLERGVPVVSLYFDQAQAGVIYSPLVHDSSKFVGRPLAEASAEASVLARSLGGISTQDWKIAGEDFDAIARASQASTVAAIPPGPIEKHAEIPPAGS